MSLGALTMINPFRRFQINKEPPCNISGMNPIDIYFTRSLVVKHLPDFFAPNNMSVDL